MPGRPSAFKRLSRMSENISFLTGLLESLIVIHYAGLSSKISSHSFRATATTNYLQKGGRLEHAQTIAAHSSPKTTKLYRTSDAIRLDKIEMIRF